MAAAAARARLLHEKAHPSLRPPPQTQNGQACRRRHGQHGRSGSSATSELGAAADSICRGRRSTATPARRARTGTRSARALIIQDSSTPECVYLCLWPLWKRAAFLLLHTSRISIRDLPRLSLPSAPRHLLSRAVSQQRRPERRDAQFLAAIKRALLLRIVGSRLPLVCGCRNHLLSPGLLERLHLAQKILLRKIHGAGHDQAILSLQIDADLRSVFNWNVKQLFVYITAEYETEANTLNQVVVWDQIISRSSMRGSARAQSRTNTRSPTRATGYVVTT